MTMPMSDERFSSVPVQRNPMKTAATASTVVNMIAPADSKSLVEKEQEKENQRPGRDDHPDHSRENNLLLFVLAAQRVADALGNHSRLVEKILTLPITDPKSRPVVSVRPRVQETTRLRLSRVISGCPLRTLKAATLFSGKRCPSARRLKFARLSLVLK